MKINFLMKMNIGTRLNKLKKFECALSVVGKPSMIKINGGGFIIFKHEVQENFE
jgi:hypothetical protein